MLTLLKNSLIYYWRTNLAVVIGVATAVAVLTGALLVGDSVRASLRDILLNRLGNADHVVSSAGFFREALAADLSSHDQFQSDFAGLAPMVTLDGLVIHEASGRRAASVQVYGVDDRFWIFNGRASVEAPRERDLMMSAGLAEELGAAAGDSLLLRVEKHSDIPTESLHGRKEDVGRTIRLSLRAALDSTALGEFSIRPQQGIVRAVFVPLARLQKDLQLEGKVNTILVAQKDRSSAGEGGAKLERILRERFTLEDVGAKVRAIEDQNCLQLESESALVSDALYEAAQEAANRSGMRTSSVLSYLANTIRSGDRALPYSLVTAFDADTFARLMKGGGDYKASAQGLAPILLNDWAASDLQAKAGDTVEIEYYVWQQEGRLLTERAQFQLAGVVPIAGESADRNLVPDYPGITESESLSDWDPPFPVDLERVRQRDEDYWDKYRTTPKAFIPLEKGQQLWQSRFGRLTSVRIYPTSQPPAAAIDSYKAHLRQFVDPIEMGLSVYQARAEGLQASRGATDFGEYFVYFSFFLMVSALLLTALFFKLGVEQRLKEIGLLRAVGFPASRIRALFLGEGVALAALGAVAGLLGALAYGGLMMLGLRTWWVEAVGTRLLTLHVSPQSLVVGAVAGIITALLCIAWTLRRLAPASPRSLLSGAMVSEQAQAASGRAARPWALVAGVIFSTFGLLLLAAALLERVGPVAGFFGAGTLLLVALFCFQSFWLRRSRRRPIQGSGWWPVSRMGFRNTTYRPGRSILCIALIASATFIIVSVDSFRRDKPESVLDKSSGTGGYALMAESLLPIVHDPNAAEGRESLNLYPRADAPLDDIAFARLRLRPGDDASCLNLYQPRNPRILAPTDDFLTSNRFSFQDSLAATEEEKANPWLLLRKELPDGAVPVIADANSLAYVLHRKLGDEITIEQTGASPIRLRVVAALSDSIFQGELLMAEKNFLRLFPDQQGYRVFLLDAPLEGAAAIAASLEEQLSDFGFDVTGTAERLAAFHRVENTYLSTFQTLGGLGLLLGTLGLATVLLRNVLERRRELALLRAMGYNSAHFRLMVLAENAFLLLCGLATGTLSALLAIAPAFTSRGGEIASASLGLLLVLVLVTGLAASIAATAAALRSPLLSSLRAE